MVVVFCFLWNVQLFPAKASAGQLTVTPFLTYALPFASVHVPYVSVSSFFRCAYLLWLSTFTAFLGVGARAEHSETFMGRHFATKKNVVGENTRKLNH